MKKTSLTRALFVAGVMAVAGGMAQADAIFYPDGTHVDLGPNAIENGTADAILARDASVSTTTLGAGPADMSRRMTTTTVTTTTPVYVFPSIDWDRATVLSQPHPMMSGVRSLDLDRTAAATFDVPTRAGEASTMTSGAPNLVTDNERVATVPAPVVEPQTTTVLGAGPSTLGTSVPPSNCGSMDSCTYLPD